MTNEELEKKINEMEEVIKSLFKTINVLDKKIDVVKDGLIELGGIFTKEGE